MKNDIRNLKKLWDNLDITKIEIDIQEGNNARKSGDKDIIEAFISKIKNDYNIYISLKNEINEIIYLRAGYNPYSEQSQTHDIDDYIKFLIQLKDAKIAKKEFEEIFE